MVCVHPSKNLSIWSKNNIKTVKKGFFLKNVYFIYAWNAHGPALTFPNIPLRIVKL